MNANDVIKSISFSQDELLRWIIRLYIPSGAFEMDPTFSSGGFYRSGIIPLPKLRYDLCPQFSDTLKADCRALPLPDAAVSSIIFDPPFLATTGASLKTTSGNIISRRFGVYPNEAALSDMYRASILEAYRVLKANGVLVFKCQDKVSGGKQWMTHCDVHRWAKDAGFEPLDLFVLLAKSRLIADWQRNQKHARKFHSYFWVFKKKKRRDVHCEKST